MFLSEAPTHRMFSRKIGSQRLNWILIRHLPQLADDVYEVALRVTVTASLGEETAFLCEVQQVGIFHQRRLKVPDGAFRSAHTARTFCSRMLASASPARFTRSNVPATEPCAGQL